MLLVRDFTRHPPNVELVLRLYHNPSSGRVFSLVPGFDRNKVWISDDANFLTGYEICPLLAERDSTQSWHGRRYWERKRNPAVLSLRAN